jgi:hypothetical protein
MGQLCRPVGAWSRPRVRGDPEPVEVAYMPWARTGATGAIPRFLFGGVLLFCAKSISRMVARRLE